MNESRDMEPLRVGLDDGYAFTKVALPDGKLVAIPSRARMGPSNVTWLNDTEQRVHEYFSDDKRFSVGEVEGEGTHFDGYPFSALNRVIVQHALQSAGAAGRSVHAVSGLPVGRFYNKDGSQRREHVSRKRECLKQPVCPVGNQNAADIAFHEVIPEALAAWYDHIITQTDDGVTLEPERLSVPIAVIDIGGRTTDFVVVADQAVRHEHSGSLRYGMLDLKRDVAEQIRVKFDLDELSDVCADQALSTSQVRLFGKDHDIAPLLDTARAQLVEHIHSETRRQLGQGAELDRVLFVGGGSLALHSDIANWFPNQQLAPHPAFANARGMLKYLLHVCDEPAND